MSGLRFNAQIISAQASGAFLIGTQVELANLQNAIIYVVFGAGTSAGVVAVEESHDPLFAGTWASLSTVTWAAANKCHSVAVVGPHRALRLNITTPIVGGTVDAYAMLNT